MVRPRVSRILVPTDFSESAQEVFGYAVTLAREWQATLILLHVVTLPPSVPEVAEFSDPRWGEERRKEAEASLQLLAREAERQGISVTLFVTLGDPSQGILNIAAEEKVDLIVMATHGRRGLSRLLHGSVAEKVVRRAPCPVLTLKPLPARRGDTGYREAA